MLDFQNLNNLPEINFKSKDRPKLNELARYIDSLKKDLFSDNWSIATKKHIKASLVLYIRSMQKVLFLSLLGYFFICNYELFNFLNDAVRLCFS